MPIDALQRQKRRRSLGSSDSPAVLGVNPFWNRYDVYIEKLFELGDLRFRDDVAIGNEFEVPLLVWAAKELGIEIDVNVACTWPEDPLFTANMDALARRNGYSIPQGLEAKTGDATGYGEEGTDEVPRSVTVQAHHQMLVAHLDLVWVPTLLARRDHLQRAIYCVRRHEPLIDLIVKEGRNFWNDHIQSEKPPDDCVPCLETVKRIVRVSGKTIEIDSRIVHDLFSATKIRKDAEDKEEELKAFVLLAIGDGDCGDYGDPERFLTYRGQSRTTVTGKALKRASPELYEELKKTTNFRVLRDVKR